MYFPFSELRKWSKRRLRLADAIVRCCLNIFQRAAANVPNCLDFFRPIR